MKLSVKALEIADIAMVSYLYKAKKAKDKGFELLNSVKEIEEAHTEIRELLIREKGWKK